MHTEVDSSTPSSTTTAQAQEATDNSITAMAPGTLRVIKRNGAVVGYDNSKITVAITKAYIAEEGGTAAASSRIHETVDKMASEINETFKRRMPSGGSIHIEEIQDQVELMLMRSGEHKVARSYVIYRAERARDRQEHLKTQPESEDKSDLLVTLDDGSTIPLDTARIRTIIAEACHGL